MKINAPSGTIYYTLNNTDPRSVGGDVTPEAMTYDNNPVIINNNLTVKARASDGNEWSALTVADFSLSNLTEISHFESAYKSDISRSYPNPFSNFTTISYNLQEAGNIEISIFSVDGRHVTNLFSGYQQKGSYSVVWRPTGLESGVYFYIISSNQFKETRKLLYVK